MDFMKTRGSKWLCATGCALAAAVCAGADVVSQPFATATADLSELTSGTWTGNGSVTNNATALYTANATVGKPIAAATDKNVLSVEGKVQVAAATTGPTSVDMMVQISKPDEALEALTDAEIKLAIGVDQNCRLNVYCAPKSGTGNAWRVLDTVYEEDSWHRVSLRFDYANGTCQVCVDGEPQVSANGYLASDKTKTGDGCWYPLAQGASGLASVQVVGTTAIDEVVVKSGATLADVMPAFPEAQAPAGDDLAAVTVPASWRVANGIPSTMTDAPDGSGMTVKAKYVTGISPLGGEKFEIKSMAMSGAAGDVKATLTVPAMTPAAGFRNVVKYGATPTALTGSVTIPSGATSVEIPVSKAAEGATVIYYAIETTVAP